MPTARPSDEVYTEEVWVMVSVLHIAGVLVGSLNMRIQAGPQPICKWEKDTLSQTESWLHSFRVECGLHLYFWPIHLCVLWILSYLMDTEHDILMELCDTSVRNLSFIRAHKNLSGKKIIFKEEKLEADKFNPRATRQRRIVWEDAKAAWCLSQS